MPGVLSVDHGVGTVLLSLHVVFPDERGEQDGQGEEQKPADNGGSGVDGQLASGKVAEDIGDGHGDGIEKKHVAMP